MYTEINFATKKELVDAVKSGRKIGCYSPGPFPCPTNGVVTVEGPHYPKPHKWYARVILTDGIITKILP